MQVNVYEEDTTTKVAGPVDLRELFCPDYGDAEYQAARRELEKTGRVWLGGGAAPLCYAQRAR